MKKKSTSKSKDKKPKKKISQAKKLDREVLTKKRGELDKNELSKAIRKKNTRKKKSGKKIKEQPQIIEEKNPQKISWMGGLLFFLIFISLSLIFFLGSSFIDRPNIAPTAQKGDLADPESINKEKSLLEIPTAKIIPPEIDSSSWKEYKSDWYGFGLNYPPNWKPPVTSNPVYHKPDNQNDNRAAVKDPWEKRFFFAKPEEENNGYLGFDVFVYNVKTIKELKNTTEFPQVQAAFIENQLSCNYNIEDHLIESDLLEAEEIYVPLMDSCLKNTFFFSVTREEYIYNIVPRIKDDYIPQKDIKEEVVAQLPDFFGVAPSFTLIKINQVKPKPKITAPMPVSFAVVNGRLVCNKKNDKPGKSDKTKHRHLDLECCLDPDEYPNPHCTYDPGKYGKYLK